MSSTRTADISRRVFVRQACCAAVGTTGILSTLAQLRVIGAVAADALGSRAALAIPSDYKALVCLFLNGGNDSSNIVVPVDSSSYSAYAKARAEVAVAQSALLPVNPRMYSDGRSYAFHPAVPEMKKLFTDGKLAVLANVGTLIQPTTLAQYNSGKAVPPQLFSHLDQITQWQSSVPDRPFETGWGGRLADMIDALNSNNQISMCISLNGANSFQRGKNVSEFAVSSGGGAAALTNGTDTATIAPISTALRNIFAASRSNLLDAAFAQTTQKANADNTLLNSVLRTAPVINTVFPNTPTASSLAGVAKLISVAPALGLKRQIFFVELRGFDLHAAQVAAHGPLLTELSAALGAFYNAIIELGVANQVTTFTASDFGRTYVPNAGGTDHGWGNHQFIMGGAVQGGDIFGAMPSLAVNGPDDTGRGRWIPSTSVDEYSATLASWFGVSASNLSIVLPNIGRFARPNLGFMG